MNWVAIGGLVIAGASAAVNAINLADPKLGENRVFKTVKAVANFLALNWVPPKS